MTTPQELQKSFETVKGYMTEDNNQVPTDKQVWERLKATAELRIMEAVAEDVECSERHWQHRLKLINAELEAIEVNQQAEQNRATNLYEQGLRHY
jgi:hypothetical protein